MSAKSDAAKLGVQTEDVTRNEAAELLIVSGAFIAVSNMCRSDALTQNRHRETRTSGSTCSRSTDDVMIFLFPPLSHSFACFTFSLPCFRCPIFDVDTPLHISTGKNDSECSAASILEQRCSLGTQPLMPVRIVLLGALSSSHCSTDTRLHSAKNKLPVCDV
jgi:hypothetical protein